MSFFSTITEEQFENMACEQLPFLRGIALRILKNAQDADDAIQNALLKGWSRRFFLRTPDRLSHWISRIVVNECYDLLRKRRREKTDAMEVLPETPAEEDPLLTEQFSQLEGAIARLPELYRQTVQIALLNDLDSESAAKELEISVNTLYQRLHKAKQMIRGFMTYG